ncbi:MAG: replication factor small subunit [Candidatus Woesearchaeota archaeon]|nr:replication factor small subunit [Candidatus Woesearchaeota archaeon]MDN5327681.1 replication factor small subunit [Candidatus Woesearchaeota archaeon]
MNSNQEEGHDVWTEKYRPKDFDEILGQEDIVKRVKAFVEKKNLPNLLFAGPPGVGKTTLALVIARKLYGDAWRENLLELNASDERGIDIIRVKVKDFARTKAISDVPFKLVYLDESDALTKEAQQALRRVMEDFTRTCRFILSCNYSSKIIEPIQSRTVFFRFKPLKKEDIFALIDKISKSEGLTVTEDGKEALYEASEGDCRKLENIMQACAALSKTIDEETVNKITSNISKNDIKKIFNLIQRKDIQNARKELIRTLLENGLSGQDLIKEIYKYITTMNITDIKKLQCIEACGEIEFRLTEGSDTIIQLEALLARIARILLENN